jgi:hypothetical protein
MYVFSAGKVLIIQSTYRITTHRVNGAALDSGVERNDSMTAYGVGRRKWDILIV